MYVVQAHSKQAFLDRIRPGLSVRLLERAGVGPFREPTGAVVMKPFLERRYVAALPGEDTEVIYVEVLPSSDMSGHVDVSRSFVNDLRKAKAEIVLVGPVTGSAGV